VPCEGKSYVPFNGRIKAVKICPTVLMYNLKQIQDVVFFWRIFIAIVWQLRDTGMALGEGSAS